MSKSPKPAGSVAAFLHENVLHFIEDSAAEDTAACLEQLSAADCLVSGRRWGSECLQLLPPAECRGPPPCPPAYGCCCARHWDSETCTFDMS